MVQLVVLHGVNTRADDPGYETSVENRDVLFRRVALVGRSSHIENPLWGDLAQKWAWNQESLPTKDSRKTVGHFGPDGDAGDSNPGEETTLLATAAKRDLTAIIDSVFSEMVAQADKDGLSLSSDQVAEFIAAARYFEGIDPDTQPPRINVPDDHACLAQVRRCLGTAGSFGLGDWLFDVGRSVVGRMRNTASTALVDMVRDGLNPTIGQFLGDIFVYLKDGPQRSAIRERIRLVLIEARQRASKAKEGFVVIGHSMGGAILYDMLSGQSGGWPAGFKVDLLVTVGSQVGVFEEFKVYESSSDQFSANRRNKVPLPDQISDWINVFDPVDVLSFRCEPIFCGVKDYMFSSVTGLASAHGAYFARPRFHARLKARLDARGIR